MKTFAPSNDLTTKYYKLMETAISKSALAQEFLSHKVRTPHYLIRYIPEDGPAEGGSVLEAFSDEEVLRIKELSAKYGESEFVEHLDEIFDEDRLCDITCHGEIFAIEVDSPSYLYSFMCHKITDNGVKQASLWISLSDEEYLRLLTLHLEDEDMNINRLRYADEPLYNMLSREVDRRFCHEDLYMGIYPYVVTMDEIRADAKAIYAQNPDLHKPGIVCYTV